MNFNFKNIFKRNKQAAQEQAVNIPVFGDSLLFGGYSNRYSAMNISSVYSAVNLISDSVAMLPIEIKQTGTAKKSVLTNHSLNFVFANSLNHLTKYTFIKLMIQDVLLKGNGFAFVERAADGTVTGLRYLNDVTIQYDKMKNELWYISSSIPQKRVEPCDMIHLLKNSYDGVNGVSVLNFAARSLKISNNTENSANDFFSNGRNLSGVLTVEGQLSAAQREQIKSSWNQAYSDGGSGLAILQGNMSYQPISLNAVDSQMLESRQFNVTDIARFFSINPVLLGDLSHSSYSTIEAAQNDFLIHTLQPFVTMIEEEFSRKLLKPSESNLTVNLDESYILRTDKTSQATYLTTLTNNGILNLNEAREKLGYGKIKDGDKHIIPFTNINDNTINKQNTNDEKSV